MQLAGLPTTLRRLRITHGDKCEHAFRKLIIAALPATPPAQGTAGDPASAPAQAVPPAAVSQPVAPACPELVSLVVDCHSTQLPVSLPLPASCAVTLHVALLTLTQVGLLGDLPAHVSRDYEKVCSHAQPHN